MKRKLIRIEQVAEMTETSVATWRHWIATKKEGIPQPARLGRRLVWTEDQINEWLDECFAEAAKETA